MADPIIIPCPEGEWTPVATNVTVGKIHKKSTKPRVYFQTYRDTGETAPTTIDEGVEMFINSIISESIVSSGAIDVYVWTTEEAGSVRVDL